jgi:hypothetical protein
MRGGVLQVTALSTQPCWLVLTFMMVVFVVDGGTPLPAPPSPDLHACSTRCHEVRPMQAGFARHRYGIRYAALRRLSRPEHVSTSRCRVVWTEPTRGLHACGGVLDSGGVQRDDAAPPVPGPWIGGQHPPCGWHVFWICPRVTPWASVHEARKITLRYSGTHRHIFRG